MARAVGYPAPCPTVIPQGLQPTVTVGQCRFQIVGLPCGGTGPGNPWHGWIIGSSEVDDIRYTFTPQHLVIAATPSPVRRYAKVVNGPAWYRGNRVEVGPSFAVHGWHVTSVFVPPRYNEGSAFAGHVVLIWTTGRHTYAIGFHDTTTRKVALAMDLELLRHLRLVG